MSVRVRLTRVGSKKNPIWRVVVADQRSPRDGRVIETIGRYNPQTEPSEIGIDEPRSSMDELLEFLAKSLVDEPDAVSVESIEEEDALVLELRVAEDDTGQVIGRRGRTISALRTVIRAVGASQDRRVLVDLVD